MLADIDADDPGQELYAAEQRRARAQFLYSAKVGSLLSSEDMGSITLNPVCWLDRPQKVYTIFSYRGDATASPNIRTPRPSALRGRISASADVLGDRREELILTRSGSCVSPPPRCRQRPGT